MATRVMEAPASVGASNGTHTEPDVIGSLDDILALDDTTYEMVSVPEWGGRQLRLVSLTGEERNRIALAMRAHAKKLKGGDDEAAAYFQARVILASLVDAEGNHIGDQSQAPVLMKKNGAALTRLWIVAMRLSGLGTEAEDEAVEVLKGIPSDDTGGD